MIQKEVFNKGMRKLAVAFHKELEREHNQLVYDTLSPIYDDRQFVSIIEKVMLLERYPSLGGFLNVARTLYPLQAHRRSAGRRFTKDCDCRNSFMFLESETADPSAWFKCPGTSYKMCRKVFNASEMTKAIKEGDPSVTLIRDQA